jgi:hypothetical protein
VLKQNNLIRPITMGLFAGVVLFIFYLGIMTWANDFSHALELLVEDIVYISLIIIGFSIQITLFIYLKGLHTHMRGASAISAGGTGTSSLGMLACCSHHVVDIFPILGLSGAALFLQDYKVYFMIFGIIVNLLGIVFMLTKIKNAIRANTVHV